MCGSCLLHGRRSDADRFRYRIPERINIRQRLMAHSGSYRYFYFRSVLRIRDREGLEENVLFHKLCIHLPSCCDPDPGADGIHPQHVHRILRCDAFWDTEENYDHKCNVPGRQLGFWLVVTVCRKLHRIRTDHRRIPRQDRIRKNRKTVYPGKHICFRRILCSMVRYFRKYGSIPSVHREIRRMGCRTGIRNGFYRIPAAGQPAVR